MQLPEDTETCKYYPSYCEILLSELIEIAEGYFPDTPLDKITIDHQKIQVKCFGYDLYDPADYMNFYIFEKIG